MHTEHVNQNQFLQGLEQQHTAVYRSQRSPDDLDRCFTENTTIILQRAMPKTSSDKANKGWLCRKPGQPAGSTQGTPLCMPALPRGLCFCFYSDFLWLCSFSVCPIHGQASASLHNLRRAPQLFAAYVVSQSRSNCPALVTCDTHSSFASCSDTDVSLFLAQRRDCTFVAIPFQKDNY